MHTAPATIPANQATVIDMYRPDQAAAALRLDDAALLDLVNRGDLAAYRLDGAIRFRVADVHACAAMLIAA